MVTVSLESLFFFFEVELLFELLLQAVKTKTRDNNKNKTVFFICATP
jgi:hypothetical protein